MPRLDAVEVANLLREFGQRTMLAGGNPYRARAYLRAAESLVALAVPLRDVVERNRLREIPNVGEAIADIIKKLHLTGSHPGLEKMRKDIPAGVLEMLKIPGLRPERIVKLYKQHGISSLRELEAATKADKFKSTKGLGAGLQRKIQQGLEVARSAGEARHIHRAAELLAGAERSLSNSDLGMTRITPAGDFRRGCELVTDLALVTQKSGLRSPQSFRSGELTIHTTDKKRYGITLLLATGSKTHLDELHRLARSKRLTITREGVVRSNKVVASVAEADIYKALGLQFIPPELREGRGEVARALRKRLPKLVEIGDIKGILHAHTQASDGVNTLEQMAEATRKRGFSYFGVADHSQSAGYAGGLSVEEIGEQHREVDRLNARYDGQFRVFKGIESDILPDGSLDYPDIILARFDFVVASVHSRFRLDRETQTERLIKATQNPRTTILGHMMGRQLLRRPGYDFDIEKVLGACAKLGVVVEINANPWRLDLDWRWHSRALQLGCMFSINPDAHSTSEIDLIKWGVLMARKGGVPKERILNCLSAKQFAQFLSQRVKPQVGSRVRQN